MTNLSFFYPVLIKEQHLDAFGHMNNAAYLTLFEEARWDIVTKNNFGMEKILQQGLGPTILEIKLRFLKELRLRQEIVIHTQLISYQKKIGRLLQKMLRGEEECCIAEFTIGLFSLKERKMVSPTPEWLQAVGGAV